MSLSCIIVEDERLARVELLRMLNKSNIEISVLGQANNANEAREMIERLRPDFIFLDIQLPEQSGIDLLATLASPPPIIFTTAYDEYATKAFELNAIDYLMKPISQGRLQQSLLRVKDQLAIENKRATKFLSQLYLTKSKRILIVNTIDILFIESIGNYAQVNTLNQKGLMKISLNKILEQLDPALFFRINRTIIIQTNTIKEIISNDKVLEVILNSGQKFSMSERRSVIFKKQTRI